MNPLVLRGITKSYPGFQLGPIDFELPRGYVTGLVGANGAGKTTMIKIALGLVHPTSGTAQLVDREKVGVVFDVPALPAQWRVRDVSKALRPFYPHWDDARFAHIAAWGGLEESKQVKDLSRGMGMKLQLAIAMAHHAEVLLFDEPTSGLDPLARQELLDMIAEYITDENNTVLFSSHITSDIEKIADHLAVISQGQLVASGTLADVVDGYRFVRGGRDSLAGVEHLVLGMRQHSAGAEGLMRTEETLALPDGVLVEAPSVEQIVIALAKAGRQGSGRDE